MTNSAKSPRLSGLIRNNKIAWTLAIVWMAIIFTFSNQAHSGDITEQYFHNYNFAVRKCAHMFEYFVLYLLLRLSTRLTWVRSKSYIPYALTVLYAMTDEFHQSFVPGRSATYKDVLVDSIGAFIAWALFLLWQELRSRQHTD